MIMAMDSTEEPKNQPKLNTDAPVYVIETEHLLFRRIVESDCDALYDILSNHDAMTYWSWAPHTDISQTMDFIIDALSPTRNQDYYFALCLKPASLDLLPKLIGAMGTISHETKLIKDEIGFILHPSYWRKGVGSEAIKGFLKSFWEARPDTLSIAADVDPRNSASLRLLKKFGFVETGSKINTFNTHIGWCDSVYLKLDRPVAESGGLATVYEESP